MVGYILKWKVNYKEKVIYVPHTQLQEAQINYDVQRLRKKGFHIQSTIA